MSIILVMFIAILDEENQQRRRRPIVQHRRNDLDMMTETEFKNRTRLSRAAYDELYELLEPEISPKANTNHAIPAHTRLQMTLRFMAQGPMYLTNSDTYGVSKASMSVHIHSVFSAMSSKVKCTINIYMHMWNLLTVY